MAVAIRDQSVFVQLQASQHSNVYFGDLKLCKLVNTTCNGITTLQEDDRVIDREGVGQIPRDHDARIVGN